MLANVRFLVYSGWCLRLGCTAEGVHVHALCPVCGSERLRTDWCFGCVLLNPVMAHQAFHRLILDGNLEFLVGEPE